MRVLIVGQCFISQIDGEIVIPGGTERYVYGLAKELQNNENEIIVLSSTKNKKEAGWKRLDNINTYRIYIPSRFYSIIADFYLFFNALKIIRYFNPSIVHMISPFYKFSSGAVVAAKLFGKKTVYTRTTYPNEKGRYPLSVFIDNFIYIPILRHADLTIVLSNHMKTAMNKKFPKIEVIPSYIMKKYLMSVDKKPYSILYVGRLDKYKGVDVLIESMRYIKKELPEATLHIVGSGEYLSHLIGLSHYYDLEKNIIFEGHLDDFELIKIYSQSSIFVFPSYREGMPMVLIEAMSSGLPIIASDIDPCIELLENGKYGVLVKVGDPEALADSICKLIVDDVLMSHYSKLCLEKSTQYTQEKIIKRIEQLYGYLINRD